MQIASLIQKLPSEGPAPPQTQHVRDPFKACLAPSTGGPLVQTNAHP